MKRYTTFLQNHDIFRYGLKQRYGNRINFQEYDRKINDYGPEKFDGSDDLVMIPVYFFGCADLYLPVKGSVYVNSEYSWYLKNTKSDYANNHSTQEYTIGMPKDSTNVLIIGKIADDTVTKFYKNARPILGYNHFYNADLRTIATDSAFHSLVTLLNDFYEKNGVGYKALFDVYQVHESLDFLYTLDDYNSSGEETYEKVVFGGTLLGFGNIDKIVATPEEYPILKNPFIYCDFKAHPSQFTFTNNFIPNKNKTSEVFVKLNGVNLWQKLSMKQFKHLSRLSSCKIKYAKVDSSRAFDKAYYYQEFQADNLREIITMTSLVCLDIDLNRLLEKYVGSGYQINSDISDKTFITDRELQYEAISVSTEQMGTWADVTITQKELGIDNAKTGKVKTYSDHTKYEIRERNDFNLLDLVVKVSNLQNSMMRRFNEPSNYEIY